VYGYNSIFRKIQNDGENLMKVSNDKSSLNIPLIHQFLSQESTWAKGIPLTTVQTSIAHSLCFGLYEDGKQIAFA
jgi:hypothetical protein